MEEKALSSTDFQATRQLNKKTTSLGSEPVMSLPEGEQLITYDVRTTSRAQPTRCHQTIPYQQNCHVPQ